MLTDNKSPSPLSRMDFLSKINPIDMELVTRCAQVLNIRQAAEKLDNMVEPVASRRLKRIETLLGTRLFERTTRSMTLSNDGERFVRQIEHVMAALEEMDLVIHLAFPKSESVGMRRLGKLKTGFFASDHYLKCAGIPQHPRELVSHRMLNASGTLFEATDIPWVDVEGTLHLFEPLEVHSCDTMSTLVSLACQGAGVTLIPLYLYDFLCQDLCPLFDGKFGPAFDI